MSYNKLPSVAGEGARLGKGVSEVVAEDGEPGGRVCRAVKGTSHMALGLLHAGGWAAPKAAHLGSVKRSQPLLKFVAFFKSTCTSGMTIGREQTTCG